jgi:hypothetical protein
MHINTRKKCPARRSIGLQSRRLLLEPINHYGRLQKVLLLFTALFFANSKLHLRPSCRIWGRLGDIHESMNKSFSIRVGLGDVSRRSLK